jgi:transketolase
MLSVEKIQELKILAINIRMETVRAMGTLGFGHLGGALSIADTLAVLYGGIMKIDSKNPEWEERDWLVSSKGHAGPAIYAALALKGYFPVKELLTLNKPGTHFPSHCDRNLTIGIDMTTGSLGQGVSTSVGVALGHKYNKKDNFTYLIIGDGETQEGQVWEGVSFAGSRKLDNIIAFVDNNKQQLDGFTANIHGTLDFKAKFESFGWDAVDVDGSDVEQIYEAIQAAKLRQGKPSVIILDTIKGKGVSFVEGKEKNHHVEISKQQMEEALAELQVELNKVMKS